MNYWAANVHNDQVVILPGGPYPDHESAMDVHVQRAQADPLSGYWTPVILMDTSKLPANGDEWRHLLRTDPLMQAVYQMGARHGPDRARGDG